MLPDSLPLETYANPQQACVNNTEFYRTGYGAKYLRTRPAT